MDQFRHAVAHSPVVVSCAGEAGVGKTRLVREAVRHTPGRPAVFVHCLPFREPLPLAPMVDALRGALDLLPPAWNLNPLVGALCPLLPEFSERLPEALPSLGEPRAHSYRLFRAARELLRTLGPAVLVVEDLHWMDGGTREFLRFLASELPPQLSLVLTCRPEDLAEPRSATGIVSLLPHAAHRVDIPLEPLGEGSVRALAGEVLGVDTVSPAFARCLYERTAGIPFVVEEVLGVLRDRSVAGIGHLPQVRAALEGLDVPVALRDVLRERFWRLSPDARRVVQAAAVLDVHATEALLTSTAGLDPARGCDALLEALGRGVLDEDAEGRYGFRHTLACQAIYGGLAGPERKHLHDRAVQAIEMLSRPPLARLAHHCKEAGRPEDWVRYTEAAADRAMEAGDDAAATQLLEEVLASPLVATSVRARLAVKFGRAAANRLGVGDSVAILHRIVEEEWLPREVRGEVRLKLGLLLINQAGDYATGRKQLERSVGELSGRPGLAARAMAALAMPALNAGHPEKLRRWMDRATDAAARSGDTVLQTAVLVNRATMLVQLGDPEVWRLARALPANVDSLAERRELARSACNLADGAVALGHFRRAGLLMAKARKQAAWAENPYMQTVVDANQLLLDWCVGRWEGLAERAATLSEASADLPRVAGEAQVVLGLLALARGELTEAERLLRRGSDDSVPGGLIAVPATAPASAGLARLCLARGEPAQAWAEADRVLGSLRGRDMLVWAAELVAEGVPALLRCGHTDMARQLMEEFADGLSGRDAPAAAASLVSCKAALVEQQRPMEAAAVYQRAAKANHRLPRPYAAARAREAAARCFSACGQDEPAVEELLAALESFESLGARWDAARCRGALRDLGIVTPSRRGRRGYGTELSPRERDVARLAAEGSTNKEIATVLHLSTRTVEGHVACALRKLGLRSRRDLAETLALRQDARPDADATSPPASTYRSRSMTR